MSAERKEGKSVEEEKVVRVFGMLAEEYAVRVIRLAALSIAATICVFLLKRNGFSAEMMLACGAVCLFAFLIAWSIAPGPDVILEARLKAEDGTRRAAGQVIGFKRGAVSDSTTNVTMTLVFETDAGPQEAKVKATIEDAVLANFGTGRTVHVLYDPDDPSRVAVDRDASPTYVR